MIAFITRLMGCRCKVTEGDVTALGTRKTIRRWLRPGMPSRILWVLVIRELNELTEELPCCKLPHV
jgi:hypothetical protein